MLLAALAALLSERATLDVTLSDVASRSGMNSAMVKYYFGNKEGLLLGLLERDAKLHMEALAHLLAMDLSADRKLRLHINGIVNAYHHSPYLNRLIHFMIGDGRPESSSRVSEIFVKPMVSAYGQIVRQGIEEGVFRSVEPAFLYYNVVGACDHFFYATYAVEPVLNAQKISDDLKRRYVAHVTDIVLKGLAP